MKKTSSIAVLIVAALAMWSCSVAPEPIHYGKDSCHACKMTIVDNRFGAELVTAKGKVYKFDDIKCMIAYYNSGFEATSDFKHILITDYAQPGSLIDCSGASFVTSSMLSSPMGGQIAAFVSPDKGAGIQQELNGESLTWDEVTKLF